MKKSEEKSEEVKTDLKHDTMEFSAATDGDDRLDLDDTTRDDDAISADELDALEDDETDDIAAGLNAAETDRMADDDALPEETEEDDYYDNEKPAEGELEGRI